MRIVNDDDEMLLPEDVARALKVSREAVMVMARAREIPMFKAGRYWRISRATFEDWLHHRETSYRPAAGGYRR